MGWCLFSLYLLIVMTLMNIAILNPGVSGLVLKIHSENLTFFPSCNYIKYYRNYQYDASYNILIGYINSH